MKSNWVRPLSGLLLGALLLSACQPGQPVWLDPVPSSTAGGDLDTNLKVYFTDPTLEGYRGGPDRELVQALDRARYEIDGAVYDLNLWSVRNALLRAHQRGVRVRLVVERDSLDREEIQELQAAGIQLITDQGEGLMHHKFFIIDGVEVWTGSMNFTLNGAYRHLNNLLYLHSRLVAENYQTEFEEMYRDQLFGEDIFPNTPHPRVQMDGVMIETYFSPDDRTAERLQELIQEADESILFLYYAFTSDQIGELVVEGAGRGLEIRGVLDTYQQGAGLGSEWEFFQEQGLDVYLDQYPEKLHHKVMILDREIVVTGSANLTWSADSVNDENTLIIHSPDLAARYLEEFEWIYHQAVQNSRLD